MKKWTIISLCLSVIPQILTAFVLFDVGTQIFNGMHTIGDFSLYSGMISQLVSNIFLLAFTFTQIAENLMKAENFLEFDSWESTVEVAGVRKLDIIHTIEFENVSFRYPNNSTYTIKDLSFCFSADDKVALVGVNGAGKTTIVKLLLRFYDATEGRILINGTDIREFTPPSIRKHYSVMFQDYLNYAFTLRDNICLSNLEHNYSDQDIYDICKHVGIDYMIDEWEDGLNAYLYKEFVEDGKELSIGENQKIALARAFYRGGDILILDEPSSSLDPESEFYFFEKAINAYNDRGLILISHKLSNVIIADHILVIEGGTLIEEGKHEDLIQSNGRYAALFKYQADKYVYSTRI
jgi:ATP-binding cassette subfamily B protein